MKLNIWPQVTAWPVITGNCEPSVDCVAVNESVDCCIIYNLLLFMQLIVLTAAFGIHCTSVVSFAKKLFTKHL